MTRFAFFLAQRTLLSLLAAAIFLTFVGLIAIANLIMNWIN